MIKASASRVPVALVVMLVPTTLLAQDPAPAPNDATRLDTVHVEAPTGEPGADRARIVAALEEVRPGGVVRFAPGTYRIGEFLQVSTPRITLAGHPEGTTLRGCDPAAFGDIEVAVVACNGLALTGERQTVRGLTFEHMWQALWVGCCLELAGGENEPGTRHVGGHLVEGNIFRASVNGFRVIGDWPEPVLVRDNDFVNVWHAGAVNGRTAHILGNRISVPDAAQVPPNGFPGLALVITPYDTRLDRAFTCAGNIVAGNRVEGHPEGIAILALRAGAICRDNVIRENTIRVDRVGFTGTPWGVTGIGDPADSTLVGVPIAFSDLSAQAAEIFGLPAEPGDEVLIRDNLIEGNHIVGAEGLGIEILVASGNRIVDNVITGVAVRDPFPGNTMYVPPPWGEANGSGIWISPGSEDNEIVGNTFEDIAGAAVVVEGDSNRVKLRSASDSMRDLGRGNRVDASRSSPPRGSAGRAGTEAWPADVPPGDTVRYTALVNGMAGGERLLWRDESGAWAYQYELGRSGFPRDERLVLDPAGVPVRLDISGQKAPFADWEERFERSADTVRWTTTVDEGKRRIERRADDSGAFYAALYPAHDPGVLARALLHHPSGRLPLLPAGEARLESLGERTVELNGRSHTLRHYAVHGLDLKPAYVWLDEGGATFADEWMIRSGWEAVFPELKAASRAALAVHVRELAERLAPAPRSRPLVIRGTRLFDPATGSAQPGTTIVIDGNRVAAVGADGSVDVPGDAEVIEAAGSMALPGLWDMHAHHGTSLIEFFRYRELDAPLHLAGGVTTARDLGSHVDELVSLRRRIEAGEAVGPRLLAAGYIDGVGGSRTGVQVETAEEARAAVDQFAELGYVQIKIYGQLPADLVHVVVERADHHGLRVSGHVPASLSAREAVEAGFDELQHVHFTVPVILGSREDLSARWQDDPAGWLEAVAELQPGSAPVREFIELLAARDVAIDPTLALALAGEVPPGYIAPVLDRFPPQARRRLLDRFWPSPPAVAAWRDRFVSSWTGFVRAAHEAGVRILPGTDLMPGFGLHRELELYVEAGIPAPEVLTLATLGAARAMGMDDELGSIEVGKLADLFLVDGDPTADISDIRRVVRVIKDGRVYDPAAIYRALGVEPCCDLDPVEVRP